MNKKIFIYLGTGIVVLAIIVFVIFFQHKKNVTPKPTGSQGTNQISQIFPEKVFFPTILNANQKIRFYANSDKFGPAAFYETDLDGQNVRQISNPLDAPIAVSWSPDSQQALLTVTYNKYIFEKYDSPFASPGTEDGVQTTWLYDFPSKSLSRLDDHIASFVWTDEGKIICQYIDLPNKINRLEKTNSDGSNYSVIADFPSSDTYSINWLQHPSLLLIYSTPLDVSPSSLYTLSLDNNKFNKIKDFSSPVMANGKNGKIIFNLPDENKLEFSIMGSDGNNLKKLDVKGSVANIVSFDDNNLLLAVVGNQGGTNLIDKLELNSLKITELDNLSSQSVDAANLLLNTTTKSLYFTSNDILYKVTLP